MISANYECFPNGGPKLEPIGTNDEGRTLFILLDDFVYISKSTMCFNFTVPKGYVTDLLSIPKSLWKIFPPFEFPALFGSIVHDILYAGEIVPRKVADKIFLQAMLDAGETPWKSKAMYYAVRVFGGFTYEKHKVDQVKFIYKMFKEKNEWL